MSLEPKDVIALVILAQSPKRHAHVVKSLHGTARRIGKAIVKPNRSNSGKFFSAARDIQSWVENNRRAVAK